jgi:hypothetical protein
MPKSLNEFLTDIKARGTVKPSRFDVVINNAFPTAKNITLENLIRTGIQTGLPGGLTGISTQSLINNKGTNLTLRCEAINLPGTQILTQDFKPYGGLPPLSVPTSRVYDPIQCTFVVSKSFLEKQYFEEWIHTITNFVDNNVAYYNDVAKTITINIYDESDLAAAPLNMILSMIPGLPVAQEIQRANNILQNIKGKSFSKPTTLYSIQLLDAIPTRIEEVGVNWASTDEVMKFSVVFSYRQIKFTKQEYNEKFAHQEQTFY